MHDCRSRCCDEPHYANDGHPGDCLCELCHEHNWDEWSVYPECDECLNQLSQWIHENTDIEYCMIPEVCTYHD